MIQASNINLILDGGMQLPVLETHKSVMEKLDGVYNSDIVEFKCYGTIQSPTSPPKIVESTMYLKRNAIVGYIAMTGKTVLSAQTQSLIQ